MPWLLLEQTIRGNFGRCHGCVGRCHGYLGTRHGYFGTCSNSSYLSALNSYPCRGCAGTCHVWSENNGCCSLLLRTSPAAAPLLPGGPFSVLIHLSLIDVAEGDRFTRMFLEQRCWYRAELGRPGFPIILQLLAFSPGGTSS